MPMSSGSSVSAMSSALSTEGASPIVASISASADELGRVRGPEPGHEALDIRAEMRVTEIQRGIPHSPQQYLIDAATIARELGCEDRAYRAQKASVAQNVHQIAHPAIRQIVRQCHQPAIEPFGIVRFAVGSDREPYDAEYIAAASEKPFHVQEIRPERAMPKPSCRMQQLGRPEGRICQTNDAGEGTVAGNCTRHGSRGAATWQVASAMSNASAAASGASAISTSWSAARSVIRCLVHEISVESRQGGADLLLVERFRIRITIDQVEAVDFAGPPYCPAALTCRKVRDSSQVVDDRDHGLVRLAETGYAPMKFDRRSEQGLPDRSARSARTDRRRRRDLQYRRTRLRSAPRHSGSGDPPSGSCPIGSPDASPRIVPKETARVSFAVSITQRSGLPSALTPKVCVQRVNARDCVAACAR